MDRADAYGSSKNIFSHWLHKIPADSLARSITSFVRFKVIIIQFDNWFVFFYGFSYQNIKWSFRSLIFITLFLFSLENIYKVLYFSASFVKFSVFCQFIYNSGFAWKFRKKYFSWIADKLAVNMLHQVRGLVDNVCMLARFVAECSFPYIGLPFFRYDISYFINISRKGCYPADFRWDTGVIIGLEADVGRNCAKVGYAASLSPAVYCSLYLDCSVIKG